MTTMNKINRIIEEVERRYDAENDTIRGGPSVTYVDMQLIELVRELARIVCDLQSEIDSIVEAK